MIILNNYYSRLILIIGIVLLGKFLLILDLNAETRKHPIQAFHLLGMSIRLSLPLGIWLYLMSQQVMSIHGKKVKIKKTQEQILSKLCILGIQINALKENQGYERDQISKPWLF